jgi:hypothetical protein
MHAHAYGLERGTPRRYATAATELEQSWNIAGTELEQICNRVQQRCNRCATELQQSCNRAATEVPIVGVRTCLGMCRH